MWIIFSRGKNNIVLPLENKIHIFAPPCNILYVSRIVCLARGLISPFNDQRGEAQLEKGTFFMPHTVKWKEPIRPQKWGRNGWVQNGTVFGANSALLKMSCKSNHELYNALAITMLKLLMLVPVFNDLVSTLFIAFYSMDNMFSKTNYQKKVIKR